MECSVIESILTAAQKLRGPGEPLLRITLKTTARMEYREYAVSSRLEPQNAIPGGEDRADQSPSSCQTLASSGFYRPAKNILSCSLQAWESLLFRLHPCRWLSPRQLKITARAAPDGHCDFFHKVYVVKTYRLFAKGLKEFYSQGVQI